MESDKFVRYKGQEFVAKVEGYEQPVRCVGVVHDDPHNCGVGVIYEDGKQHIWGLLTPRNLIAAWRGVEILRHMPSIDSRTLHDVYTAGLRHPHDSDQKTVKKVVAQIGARTYRQIMRQPIPEAIVSAIVEGQTHDFQPALYPVTEEVRAGTITWRMEFEIAGIEHPDKVDADNRKYDQIIRQHKALLTSYARMRGLSRQSNGMWHVEAALHYLVDRGMAGPKCRLVALAGVAGELASFELASMVLPFHWGRESYKSSFDEHKSKAFSRTAQWLQSHMSTGFWIWRTPNGSVDEYEQELIKLLDQHFPDKEVTSG